MDLAERLGVDQRTLAAVRVDALIEGDHWTRRGGRFEYTPAGVEKIGAMLRTSLATATEAQDGQRPAPGADRGTAKDGGLAVDLVVGRRCPNPTWVKCMHEGAWVEVSVKNNRGLRIGATLKGCVPDQYGRFVYPGRCPFVPAGRAS
jgi:hypothetical protein